MGAYTSQGQGITQATRLPWVREAMEIIHQLAALRDLRGRAAGYTSINIQTNSLLHAHRDRNDFGSSWLLACGSFTGGQLW
eukprot:1291907-Amphidinium_carterae.1